MRKLLATSRLGGINARKIGANKHVLDGNAKLLPVFADKWRNITHHTFPEQRHPNRSMASADAEVNPLKNHHPSSSNLGSDSDKHAMQWERPAWPNGLFQSGPCCAKANGPKDIAHVDLQLCEGVNSLAMPLDEGSGMTTRERSGLRLDAYALIVFGGKSTNVASRKGARRHLLRHRYQNPPDNRATLRLSTNCGIRRGG